MKNASDQIEFHQHQARRATNLMLGFFVIAIILVGWRLFQSTKLGPIAMGLEDLAALSQELRVVREEDKWLEVEEEILRTGSAPRTVSVEKPEDRGQLMRLESDIGIASLDCSDHGSTIKIPIQEHARAKQLAAAPDASLLEQVCSSRRVLKPLPIFSVLQRELGQHRTDPNYCPSEPEKIVEEAERQTGPSSFDTFDSGLGVAGDGACKLNWDYVEYYLGNLPSFDPPSAASIRTALDEGIKATEERLAQVGADRGALGAKRAEIQDAIAKANEADDGWEAKLARNSTEMWLNTLLVIVALLGVNAGYRLNRSHNFEIVRIRRQLSGIEAAEKIRALGLALSNDLVGALVSSRDPNPFSGSHRDGTLETVPVSAAKELVASISSATKSLAEAVRALKLRV